MIVRLKDYASDIPSEFRAKIGDDRWVGFGTAADVEINGKSFDAVDSSNKRITFVSSDDKIDRDEERIAAGAFHELIGNYKRAGSPVISSHLRALRTGMSAVAGHAVEMFTKTNPFVSIVEFIGTEIGNDLWAAYRVGAQRGISVSFRAIDIGKENDIPVITKAELLEQSLVVIPANPRAVAMSVVRDDAGKAANASNDSGEVRELKVMVAELTGRMDSLFGPVVPDEPESKTDGDGPDDETETLAAMMDCFRT